jgi:hypothetical protein
MDVNVCIEKAALRETFKAAAENMPHEEAIEHVAETHLVPADWVAAALAEAA